MISQPNASPSIFTSSITFTVLTIPFSLDHHRQPGVIRPELILRPRLPGWLRLRDENERERCEDPDDQRRERSLDGVHLRQVPDHVEPEDRSQDACTCHSVFP